jgi:hypothetical protein
LQEYVRSTIRAELAGAAPTLAATVTVTAATTTIALATGWCTQTSST